ncbi:Mph(E)/Mph(G) family macrolide 2'-phosphotransferase [Algoriphagus sp. AGSA1]|uniref:Mph(E)/Mph(G) family macrolide 2'-phosphotransferase n=1 Tax=Algoriphagus sp. AGSA1 TaxID=2907213 RepID=UPI001F1EBF2F|nr:Mph(E)/Mph(G) family macrolide 2'-phosphotransferase [Algoriphagus sp. AGSA1]MCE7053494.1 Mph(E)/Mph(G) family macrolide 2'-phosphotransferase [Algoriphagus sp. AGSA1]
MTIHEIINLAKKHGLTLSDDMKFNEMGIDFKVGFATDNGGKQWVLRIPRRSDLGEQIDKEKRILQLVGKHLSIQVPDWLIASPQLIAYPLLKDNPALTFDASTYAVTWNIDQNSPKYVPSLAKALVELHSISETEVLTSGLKVMHASELRPEIADRLQLVKSELGISKELEKRYRQWLDNDSLWPGFTRFIHGDLYAGHVLTTKDGVTGGIIDWSTAHIGDISLDFSGHVTVFGEDSLKELIAEYEKQGGAIWEKLYEQTLERAAASPLAYGFFAIETQDDTHINAAKGQLGV